MPIRLKKKPRTTWPKCPGVTLRGRVFTQIDLVRIRRLVRDHPNWGRTRLSIAVCECLSWNQPNGRPKDRACRVALLALESKGYLRLPPKLVERGGKRPIADRELVIGDSAIISMPKQIDIIQVQNLADRRIWNAIIDRHHYLGLATPVGRLIRYLMYGDGCLLGGISFTEPAWRITSRDLLLSRIGIAAAETSNAVVNNARFLILPNVKVANLASRLLSKSLKRLQRDWHDLFGSRPLIAETFVDTSHFRGTCYLASNWIPVGMSKGFSKSGSGHKHTNRPKLILLRGLSSQVNASLRIANEGASRRAA